MGGANSKSSQTITNNTVNKNYMDTLNSTIMNSAVETMINNASSCSSAVNINNSCDMSNTKIAGDFVFGGKQTAKADINFNCIQANQTSSDMATAMMTSILTEMKALNGTEAASDLNNAAQASNTSGFASMPSSSKSNAKTNVTNNITNETISEVKNIFETNLSNNFSVNTVNECIGKTQVSNTQDLSNMDIGGGANVECIQTATIEQVQNCKQLSDAVSKTTHDTFQELGLSVGTESATTALTESTVTSLAENVSTGPIQEVGTAIAGIFSSLGFGSISGVIIIVLVLFVIGYFAVKSMGGSSGTTIPGMQQGIPDMSNMMQPGMSSMSGMQGGTQLFMSDISI